MNHQMKNIYQNRRIKRKSLRRHKIKRMDHHKRHLLYLDLHIVLLLLLLLDLWMKRIINLLLGRERK